MKGSKGTNTDAEDSQLWHRTSVRRFGSFKLFSQEELSGPEGNLLDDAHLARCTAVALPSPGTWVRYSYRDTSSVVSAAVKCLTSPASLSTIIGFNNTGNVCVWPSEEVMAWYCLRNAHRLIAGRSVCELGCGMTALAGLMLACTGLPSYVLLTDGNETSVHNVEAILSANASALLTCTAKTSTCVLRWDEAFLSQRSPHDGFFDVIVCADCVFFTELHACLTRVLLKLLKPHGTVILFAPERGGTLRQFCEVAGTSFAVRRLDTYDDVVDQRHQSALHLAGGEYDPNIHYPVLVEMEPLCGDMMSGSVVPIEEH